MSNERNPLLSDRDGDNLISLNIEKEGRIDPHGCSWLGFEVARKYYEDLITQGKLLVVMEASIGNVLSPWVCSLCGKYTGRIANANFCPGCGQPIKKQ